MWFIDRILGSVSQDIGIDLGTANTLVYVKDRGIVLNEPSVVAVNTKTDAVLAVGLAAKNMVGRTPAHIVATRPLVDGVISNFEITETMLRYFIGRVQDRRLRALSRPRVVVGIPSGVTEVEKRAVEDACRNAGARETFLIEEPLAAAIGARLPVHDAGGCMIVDIGGGTAEMAVISLGGIVVSRSLRVAGDELNDNIVQYARDEFNLLIGDRTAEQVKIAIGSAIPLSSPIEATLQGRDLVTGLPKSVTVSDSHIREALSRSIQTLIEQMKSTIEETPPELIADIMQRGIYLAGGGALLRGLDQLISHQTEMPVLVAEDPLTCVVRGCGIVLQDIDQVRPVLVQTARESAPRFIPGR